MSKLIFEVTRNLIKIVEHTIAAKKWRCTGLGRVSEPILFLVHGRGIYLMSGGTPGLYKTGSKEHLCVYAKDCDPHNGGWWETNRNLVGGDDFSEALPAPYIADEIKRGAKRIILVLSESNIQINVE